MRGECLPDLSHPHADIKNAEVPMFQCPRCGHQMERTATLSLPLRGRVPVGPAPCCSGGCRNEKPQPDGWPGLSYVPALLRGSFDIRAECSAPVNGHCEYARRAPSAVHKKESPAVASGAPQTRQVVFGTPRLVQFKRNGHRNFCLSASVHKNDIAYNRLRFLACRFHDVIEQLRDFRHAQHGIPHRLEMT
jgi:hypothetical protein